MQHPEVIEFLSDLKPSTRRIYRAGIETFNIFYAKEGNIIDFIDRVEADNQAPRRERKRIAANTMKAYIDWLTNQGFKPKTVRAYTTAVQSLARFLDVPISLRYANLPTRVPASKKHPWTLESIGKFIGSMQKPMYRALATMFFQSGLSVSDTLALKYGDIKDEFEQSITPLCIDLVRIKTDIPHLTFIGKLGVEMLREYLAERQPSPSDPLFPVGARAVDKHFKRLSRKFIGQYEGYNPMRPHSLRAAFRTLLVDAGCPETYAEFWMGHAIPDVKSAYISKSREGWRQEYAKYEHALTFSR